MDSKAMEGGDMGEEQFADLDEFFDQLDLCLAADDKDRFIQIFKKEQPVVSNFLMDQCITSGAKKCITALLCGEVPGAPRSVTRETLCSVAACPDPYIIKLLMTQCNGASRLNSSCSVEEDPLYRLLCLFSFYEPVCHWSKGDSLFKLVILLCQSEVKDLVDSLRILADYKNSVNEIAWALAKKGNLSALAALLLVAHGKVTAPCSTGMGMVDMLTKEVAELSDSTQVDLDYKSNLAEAEKLLNIFERAGNALGIYVASMPKSVSVAKVVNDVIGVFKLAGFSLTYEDIDLSHYFSSLDELIVKLDDKLTGLQTGNALGGWSTGNQYPPSVVENSTLAKYIYRSASSASVTAAGPFSTLQGWRKDFDGDNLLYKQSLFGSKGNAAQVSVNRNYVTKASPDPLVTKASRVKECECLDKVDTDVLWPVKSLSASKTCAGAFTTSPVSRSSPIPLHSLAMIAVRLKRCIRY